MKKYVYRHKESGKTLSKEEVEKLRDFKRLKTDYERASKDLYRNKLYRDPKLFLGLLLVILVLWILWSNIEQEEKELEANPPAQTEATE